MICTTTLYKYIEEHPNCVDKRESFGDFEIDTIVGKRNGHESVVLTLIERRTRFEIVRLIDGRDAASIDYKKLRSSY